jgi:integrase/recombinase XerD
LFSVSAIGDQPSRRASSASSASSGEPEEQRVTIGQAIDEYLDFIKAHRKERTYVTYRYTLDKLLRQWCRKSYVDQSRESHFGSL